MKFNLGVQILAMVATIGVTGLTTGCGGGGGDRNMAPNSLNGKTLTFQDPDIPANRTSFSFTSANYTSPGGDSGTYVYARSATIHQASLQLNSVAATTLNYQLTFTSNSGGTFLDTDTAKTSTFTTP
jgi:hypothetical protein